MKCLPGNRLGHGTSLSSVSPKDNEPSERTPAAMPVRARHTSNPSSSRV